MKKLKIPLRIPKGLYPKITQAFGDKRLVDWYKKNGVDIDFHNGVDITVGNSVQTYGTAIVAPIKSYYDKVWFDEPMSTKGNGIAITFEHDKEYYRMIAWHTSENVEKNKYKEGDTIAYIGNSGLVTPKPTPSKAHNGAHIHLMLYKNGELIDPMELFDITQWYEGDDTGVEKDLPPLFWALQRAKELLNELLLKK